MAFAIAASLLSWFPSNSLSAASGSIPNSPALAIHHFMLLTSILSTTIVTRENCLGANKSKNFVISPTCLLATRASNRAIYLSKSQTYQCTESISPFPFPVYRVANSPLVYMNLVALLSRPGSPSLRAMSPGNPPPLSTVLTAPAITMVIRLERLDDFESISLSPSRGGDTCGAHHRHCLLVNLSPRRPSALPGSHPDLSI
jgi:hypothetical protein